MFDEIPLPPIPIKSRYPSVSKVRVEVKRLPPTTVTIEEAEERLAKLSIHEAIRDWIAATRYVGQQLYQADPRAADGRIHEIWREKIPSIDHVQRCPADEKFQHDHEQHPYHLGTTRRWNVSRRSRSLVIQRGYYLYMEK